MQKIIVTGGSGFIGTNLIKKLLEMNYKVINLDKLSYASNRYIKIKNKNYKFFNVDLNNKLKVYKILEKFKPNTIFNLAAETHVDRSIDNPYDFIHSNILGTYNLLECIRKVQKKNTKIKLIHISTDEVYGDLDNLKIKPSENSTYKPSSPYSATKASADHLVTSYIRTYKINAMISNCCNNYGPYQFPEKLIPKTINNIIKRKPVMVYAKGKNIREWIFVEDHCKALIKIMKKGKIGNSYNVGSGQSITNIDLIKKIINIMKKNEFSLKIEPKIKFVKDRPGHDKIYSLNSKKIKKELHWRAKYNLNDGIYLTIKWYLENIKYLSSIKEKNYDRRLGLQK